MIISFLRFQVQLDSVLLLWSFSIEPAPDFAISSVIDLEHIKSGLMCHGRLEFWRWAQML
jgi:hypothetical protein